MLIAEALRLLRTGQGLTQLAASKLPDAPNCRTLSHWENQRKVPSLKLLYRYLKSLGLDLYDLQDALAKVEGNGSGSIKDGLERLELRLGRLEARLGPEEPAAAEDGGGGAEGATGRVSPRAGPRDALR